MSRSQGVLFHNNINGKAGYHEEGDKKNDGKYDGEIENGLPNGQGTFTFPNSTQIYVGTLKDGLREGKGTYTWSDGGKYEGEYRNNRRNGKGKRTTPDGSIGEGEFHDGDLWNGTIMDKDGDIISKIANGSEVNLLSTEVYSYIEWKENETTTRT